MPEIKNNFLRGRMNKDHDERLVGKGEYVDAMNIQVSSSDGSNVGSVQNILANREIGTEFWNNELGAYWKCVGSIASEKDNKFYYFLAKKTFVWENSFENNGEGWELESNSGSDDPWIFSPGTNTANSNPVGDNYGWMKYTMPVYPFGQHPKEGLTYRLTYDLLEWEDTSQGQLILANATTGLVSPYLTGGANVPLIRASDGVPTPGRYSVDWVQGDVSEGYIRLWTDSSGNFKIANLKIEEQRHNFIMEYDTNKDTTGQNLANSPLYNSVTPVFSDPGGDVLKFHPDRHITAINIIDGLLFWTDNYSEPKKINIQRCIDGTALDGQSATTFESNLLETIKVEESHISVIKKAPKKAPLVRKERFRHKDKQYSADMRISSGDAIDNDFINSSKGVIHDFSFLNVGDTFRTKLVSQEGVPEPVSLEWKPGDEVVLKEYPTHGYNAVEYRIKATLTNWPGNILQTNNYIINSNRNLDQGSQGIASRWGGFGFLQA